MKRQRGIALMLVLWMLTLLTVMAVSMTAAQRTEMALTENHVAVTRFRLLSDAAIAYTALRFLTPDAVEDEQPAPELDDETTQSAQWQPNGMPHPWRFAGTELTISVFNELSRLNLNQTEPAVLTSLLEILGVSEDAAAQLADAIADWRDEDDLTQLNGAEDDDYRDTGAAIGAKDGPFVAVDELRQVLGITQEIYRRLAPEVTVEGEGADPEIAFASPAILAATQGISLEEAQLQIVERDTTTVPGARGPRAANRGGPLYRIQVTDDMAGQGGRRMEALMELMPGQQPPYLVHWRRFNPLREAE